MFITATREVCTFYVRKEEIFSLIQGMFLLNTLVSPLLAVSPGGILYSQVWFFGMPLITNMRTVNEEVPYKQWPSLVRVMTNTFSAPFFWKIKQFSYGLLNNPPRNKEGNPINVSDVCLPSSPKELDLFINYLQNLNDV